MPAMARTREKGKRVALCSLHNSCNRDLLDPAAHLMDLSPIWLDDHFEVRARCLQLNTPPAPHLLNF
jgi:hypothetical protein